MPRRPGSAKKDAPYSRRLEFLSEKIGLIIKTLDDEQMLKILQTGGPLFTLLAVEESSTPRRRWLGQVDAL